MKSGAKPLPLQRKKWNLCLNFSRWDEINEFAMEANLKLVFGMSYPGTNLNKNSAVPPLDVTQNLALLKYSISKGYRLAAVELGKKLYRQIKQVLKTLSMRIS